MHKKNIICVSIYNVLILWLSTHSPKKKLRAQAFFPAQHVDRVSCGQPRRTKVKCHKKNSFNSPCSTRAHLQSQGRISPQPQGRVSPQSQGRVSPQSQGRVSPQSQGRVSPQSQGRVSPQSQAIFIDVRSLKKARCGVCVFVCVGGVCVCVWVYRAAYTAHVAGTSDNYSEPSMI